MDAQCTCRTHAAVVPGIHPSKRTLQPDSSKTCADRWGEGSVYAAAISHPTPPQTTQLQQRRVKRARKQLQTKHRRFALKGRECSALALDGVRAAQRKSQDKHQSYHSTTKPTIPHVDTRIQPYSACPAPIRLTPPSLCS